VSSSVVVVSSVGVSCIAQTGAAGFG
jgi:hypothetical protein